MTKILHFPHKNRINKFGASSSETSAPGWDSGLIPADSTTPNLTSGSTPSVEEEMSISLMLAVWPLKSLTIHEKFILMALADYANSDAVCWPCMATLAEKAAMSKATARKAVASLESKGLLYRSFRTGHATKYHIKLTPLQSSGVEDRPHSKRAPLRSNTAHHPATMERQNLSLEPVKKQQDFSCEEKEEREVSPELREMLDNLYNGMKA